MVNFRIKKATFFGEMGYAIYVNGKKELWRKTKIQAKRKIKSLEGQFK